MYKDVPDALHLAVTVACPASRVRDLLTTPGGLTSWLATDAEFTAKVGAPYRLTLSGGQRAEGFVQGYDPACGVAYSFDHDGVRRAFGVTVVRWSWEGLSPDYTLVTLTHTGHSQGDAWQRAYEGHMALWTAALRNLTSVVNDGRDLRRQAAPSS
jgi:uncharacterized protein YndB with AHSA1/START domain